MATVAKRRHQRPNGPDDPVRDRTASSLDVLGYRLGQVRRAFAQEDGALTLGSDAHPACAAGAEQRLPWPPAASLHEWAARGELRLLATDSMG